jgi:Flp pilus assembly protein TadG
VRAGLGSRGSDRRGRGQATVETVALVPVLVAIGLGILQLLAVGYASVLAGNAAEAGALALAAGNDARDGAKRAQIGRAHV